MRSIERTECRDICATLPVFEKYDAQLLSDESFTLLVCAGGFDFIHWSFLCRCGYLRIQKIYTIEEAELDHRNPAPKDDAR